MTKAEQQGATVVCDGRALDIVSESEGFYVGPTLLDNITPEMDIFEQEVFGPARNVVRVPSLDHAIELINSQELANGVTIFTNDGHASRKFTTEIDVGMVGVNVPIPIPVGYHNFAGFKGSRFGEGHMFGPDQARFFTKTKTVSERWITPSEQTASTFAFPSNNE